MRTLTGYERDLVAGGTLTGSTDEPWVWGGGGGGTGDGGGESGEPEIDVSSIAFPSHPLVAPDAFVDELGMVFDAVSTTLDAGAQSQQEGQNSSPEEYQNYGAIDQGFSNVFGWAESLRDNPAAAFWQYLTGDVDPEFLLETITPSSISGGYQDGSSNLRGGVNMHMIDSSRAIFNINGQIIFGEYHSTSPSNGTRSYDNSTGSATDIVVIARPASGYWTVSNAVLPGFPSSVPTPPPAASTHGAGPVVGLPAGWNTVIDAAVDKAVSHLAAEIKAKSDYDHYEYSAIVWVDTHGIMHESLIVKGGKTQAAGVAWSEYGVPAGSGAFKVVALIHNHPLYYPMPIGPGGALVDTTNANRIYIDNYDLGSMQQLVTDRTAYKVGGVNMLRYYIQHDDVVDKYNYVQNPFTPPVAGTPIQPLPLAPKAVFNPAP